jgi:hypothetical protein
MSAKEESHEIIDEFEEKDIEPTETMTNNTLRNLGSIIVFCSLLLLFGGDTFAWWHVSMENEEDPFWDIDLRFGTNEFFTNTEGSDYSLLPALEGVFSVVKILLYLLLLCGAALTYMGQTGNKIEFETETITGSILITLLIILYVFLSLPQAFEDSDLPLDFAPFDKEPAFFSPADDQVHFTAGPSFGWFVSILIWALSSTYLWKNPTQSLSTMLENITDRSSVPEGKGKYQRSMDIDEGVKYGFDMLKGIAKYLIIILIIEVCGILFIMYSGGSEATIVIGVLLFIVGWILSLALSIGIMYKLWVDIFARSRE